jgi:ribosome-associated protein
VNEPIVVAPGVLVPAEAMHVAAVRAAGPGGQNVNKVSSKVQIHVDLRMIKGLSAAAFARLRTLAGRRLDTAGQLVISSQRTRDQQKNLLDARTRIRELIASALIEPVPRKPTRPGRGAVQRRLNDKRRQGDKKQQRRVSTD